MTGNAAADVGEQVSADRMKSLVAELASSRYAGRRVGGEGCAKARALVAGHLVSSGFTVAEDRFPVGDGEGVNLYARIPGADPAAVEVLLTAHLDGVGDLADRRRPGASDNASGVTVVVEAARLLAAGPVEGVGVSLALLDAEEVGALGSAHHASALVAAGARPLVMNVDGAGRIDEAVAVEADNAAHGLLSALDQAGRAAGVRLRAGQVASDNRRYAAAGLAVVGLGAGMPGYHTEHDTAERVEAETLVAIARLVVATVRELGRAVHTAREIEER